MLTLKRILFYVISFTWGGVLSLIGFLIMLPFLVTKRVSTYHGRLYGIFPKCFGNDWGFEMGCFFFIAENCKDDDYLRNHESGHGLQNCVLGIFQIIIQISSFVRYWYREYKTRHNIPLKNGYDDIWFERWATDWGTKFVSTDIL